MNGKRALLILIGSLAMLAAGVTPRLVANSQALPPTPERAAGGTIIPYTGRLSDEQGGAVAQGAYDLAFTLYDVEKGGEPVWSEVQEGIQILGGNLLTALGAIEPIPPTVLEGQPVLWLAVGVRGPGEADFTLLEPRQRLSAETPAAPADTSNDLTCAHDHVNEAWVGTATDRILSIANNGDGDGIWGSAVGAGSGVGVYGMSWNGAGLKGTSVNGRGVEGFSSSTNEWAPAVYGSHDGAGDGVYGVSQNRYGLYGVSKSADAAGVYARNDGGGAAIQSNGDLYVTGAFRGDQGLMGGAPFPRPAYESAWLAVEKGDCLDLPHNLGGNEDDYVVDLQFMDRDGYRHIFGYGGANLWGDHIGGHWTVLTNQWIRLCRLENDLFIQAMRVRIWIIR